MDYIFNRKLTLSAPSPGLSLTQSFYPTWIIILIENLHFRLQALVFPLLSFYPTWIIFLLENLHFRLQALFFPLLKVFILHGLYFY